MVLQTLDGSQPLATAAYNAGPGRPQGLALDPDAAGGRRDLRRDHSVRGNPRLCEERAVQRDLLCRAVRQHAAVAEGPAGHDRAQGL